MFGGHFYHERVRKSVAVFGSLFDDIYIVRKSGGNVVAQMKVPLSYGPKRKFLERIAQMSNGEDTERQLAIKLPRMSFEMLAMSYDAARQLPKITNFKKAIPNDETRQGKYYVGAPYTLSFQLNIYAKSQDDALQIVEQIIPYFQPQYTVSVKPYADVNDIVEDVPTILTAVSFSDDYEGDLAQDRTIIYTLDFDMKVGFYGPGPSRDGGTKIIREVNTNIYLMDVLGDSDGFVEAVQVVPNPTDVSPDSDYTLTINILDTPFE